MQRILSSSAALALACATTHQPLHPPLLERTVPVAPTCVFGDPEHSRTMELRMPGGGPVIGKTSYGDEGWPRVDAMLIGDGSPSLYAAVAGGGLNLWLEIDVSDQEVLVAAETIDLGPAGGAAIDADILVVGVDGDQLVVRPGHAAFEVFEPAAPVDQVVACEAVTLEAPLDVDDSNAELFASFGLEPARAAWIDASEAVPVLAAPDGDLLGHLRTSDGPHGLKVLDESDSWLHVAIGGLYTRVVWQGWIEARYEETDEFHGIGGLGTRGKGLQSSTRWRECAARQPVFLQPTGREPVHVGWMDPQTLFSLSISEDEGAQNPEGLVPVFLHKPWLSLEAAVMFLPEEAAECGDAE